METFRMHARAPESAFNRSIALQCRQKHFYKQLKKNYFCDPWCIPCILCCAPEPRSLCFICVCGRLMRDARSLLTSRELLALLIMGKERKEKKIRPLSQVGTHMHEQVEGTLALCVKIIVEKGCFFCNLRVNGIDGGNLIFECLCDK